MKIKPNEDYWLLFHVGKVTKDLEKFNGVGFEYGEKMIFGRWESYVKTDTAFSPLESNFLD